MKKFNHTKLALLCAAASFFCSMQSDAKKHISIEVARATCDTKTGAPLAPNVSSTTSDGARTPSEMLKNPNMDKVLDELKSIFIKNYHEMADNFFKGASIQNNAKMDSTKHEFTLSFVTHVYADPALGPVPFDKVFSFFKVNHVSISADGKQAMLKASGTIFTVSSSEETFTAKLNKGLTTGNKIFGTSLNELGNVTFLKPHEYYQIAKAVYDSPTFIENKDFFNAVEEVEDWIGKLPGELPDFVLWGSGNWISGNWGNNNNVEFTTPIKIAINFGPDSKYLLSLDGKWLGDFSTNKAYQVSHSSKGYVFKRTKDNIPGAPAAAAKDSSKFLSIKEYRAIAEAYEKSKSK